MPPGRGEKAIQAPRKRGGARPPPTEVVPRVPYVIQHQSVSNQILAPGFSSTSARIPVSIPPSPASNQRHVSSSLPQSKSSCTPVQLAAQHQTGESHEQVVTTFPTSSNVSPYTVPFAVQPIGSIPHRPIAVTSVTRPQTLSHNCPLYSYPSPRQPVDPIPHCPAPLPSVVRPLSLTENRPAFPNPLWVNF